MTERFTERTKKVLSLAREEAARLRHEFIGTEHLLLGLVAEGSGVAAQVLARMEVDLARVRTAVEAVVQAGPTGAKMPDKVFLTPRAKRAMDAAAATAKEMGHSYIGTEHLLMGLLREGEGVAARVLRDLGLGLEDIRAATEQFLSQMPGQPGAQKGQAAEEEAEEEEEAGGAEGEPSPSRPTRQREVPWPEWVKAGVNAPELLAAEQRMATVRAAKDQAVEKQDFEGAAQRRDEERRLRAALPQHAALRILRALLDRPDDPACIVLRDAGLDLAKAQTRVDELLRDVGEPQHG
jgi:hypothetical protein